MVENKTKLNGRRRIGAGWWLVVDGGNKRPPTLGEVVLVIAGLIALYLFARMFGHEILELFTK